MASPEVFRPFTATEFEVLLLLEAIIQILKVLTLFNHIIYFRMSSSVSSSILPDYIHELKPGVFRPLNYPAFQSVRIEQVSVFPLD